MQSTPMLMNLLRQELLVMSKKKKLTYQQFNTRINQYLTELIKKRIGSKLASGAVNMVP